MFSRMQTTEVLLRWKYVRQAVGRAWQAYTLVQFTISDAKIFRYITHTPDTSHTHTHTHTHTRAEQRRPKRRSLLYEKTLVLLIC